MQKVLKTLVAGLALAGGFHTAAAEQQHAALLVYQVMEEGVDPYISRVLVTPSHVRMDEGAGAAQYTLYDREKKVIYNVDAEERSVLVMDPPAADLKLPAGLKLAQQLSTDPEAPRIGGREPQQVVLQANGKTCRELVAVPGLMDEALAGMRDLQATLALVQAATLGAIPADMQSDCDLADNVYAPLRALEHGLPIQEFSPGRRRALVDFVARYPVEDDVMALPADYQQTAMPGLMAR